MNTAESAVYCGCDAGANHRCERHSYAKISTEDLRIIMNTVQRAISLADDVNCPDVSDLEAERILYTHLKNHL